MEDCDIAYEFEDRYADVLTGVNLSFEPDGRVNNAWETRWGDEWRRGGWVWEGSRVCERCGEARPKGACIGGTGEVKVGLELVCVIWCPLRFKADIWREERGIVSGRDDGRRWWGGGVGARGKWREGVYGNLGGVAGGCGWRTVK